MEFVLCVVIMMNPADYASMEKGSVMVSVCKCLWFLEKIKVSQLFFNVQFTLSELSIL